MIYGRCWQVSICASCTSLTLCIGVRSPRAVPLWRADGHASASVGRQRASRAVPNRTWGCLWSRSASGPSETPFLWAAWCRESSVSEKEPQQFSFHFFLISSYLCSGTWVSEMTMLWSMKMSSARRKPSPTALSVASPDSFSKWGKLKTGPSWMLNRGTIETKPQQQQCRKMKQWLMRNLPQGTLHPTGSIQPCQSNSVQNRSQQSFKVWPKERFLLSFSQFWYQGHGWNSTRGSALSSAQSELTLYVKEKVGADEREDNNRDGQSTVRHHLSDFAIKIWAAEREREEQFNIVCLCFDIMYCYILLL